MTTEFDREEWRTEPGPWQGEPDRKEWRHAGFACLIVRNRMGALCGYVGTPPPGRPWHGKGYNDIPDHPSVHGGLTYSGECSGDICHTPAEGEPEVWWHGFDCNHSGDIAPGMVSLDKYMRAKDPAYDELMKLSETAGLRFPEQYRDIEYVTREVESLAEQAAALSGGANETG